MNFVLILSKTHPMRSLFSELSVKSVILHTACLSGSRLFEEFHLRTGGKVSCMKCLKQSFRIFYNLKKKQKVKIITFSGD